MSRNRITSENFQNKRFGRLTISSILDGTVGRGNRIGICRCDCGNLTTVVMRSILAGKTRSCGCLAKEHAKQIGKKNGLSLDLVGRNRMLRQYKLGAKTRNLEWDLPDEDFELLIRANCWYCGAIPSERKVGMRKRTGAHKCNGVDRLDNSKGYISGNVVPCCRICNFAKNDLTLEEFQEWIKKIFRFQCFEEK